MIEDDEELAEILCEFLYQNGIEVTNFAEPFSGISHLKYDKECDLVILDLSLPNLDGLEVCKKIREISCIPIIISSARSDINDKVDALEFGADDYLPKPYDPKELVARVKSILRRSNTTQERPLEQPKAPIEIFSINESAYSIFFHGTALELTRAEYEVLSLFIHNKNCALSREDIVDSAPSISHDASAKTIDVIISRIRAKLGDDSKNPTYIKSVRGIGYKLCL